MTILLFLLFVVLTISSSANNVEIQYFDLIKTLENDQILETLRENTNSSECKRDLFEYLLGLRQTKIWALTMFDSSAKIPEGILKGNLKYLGQYDECLSVEHPEKNFTGQHCMFDITVKLSQNDTIFTKAKSSGVSIIPTNINLPLFYGLCLPSTCIFPDINAALELIPNITGKIINITVKPDNCRTKGSKPIASSDWVVIGVLIAFGIVAVISTMYDVSKILYQKDDKPHPLLSSFSFYSNGKQLFRISDANGQLKSLHGLRFFSMCWVILCHSLTYSISGAPTNLLDAPKEVQSADKVFYVAGVLAVDSFFFLSGLLVCFVFFRDISRKKSYDVPLGYIHRYIRLTPPYGMMILIQATIFIYFGDGPLWNSIAETASQDCRKDWWSGLLYVQNLATPGSQCLGQSWYLSTDMQMYWLSPLILYPMLLLPVLAPFYLLVLILAVTFTDFAISYVNDLGPHSIVNHDSAKQWRLDYIQFYTRAAPWLIGVAVAYLICGIQAKKIEIKLNKSEVIVGWVISTALCLGTIYSYMPFTDFDYSTLEASFFLAFSRVAWGIGLAWVVFACTQGYGGPANAFLSCNVFQPLGKLSYCTFLIHVTIQYYRVGILRTSVYLGDTELIYYFLGDLTLANLLAIPFTLLFEMPFSNIDRYMFQNIQILPLPRPTNAEKAKEENNNETT